MSLNAGPQYEGEFDSNLRQGPGEIHFDENYRFEGEYIHIGATALQRQAKGQPNFTIYDPDRPNLRKWGTNMAAYELDADGDTLRACYAHDGRKVLTECKPEKGIHYYVFKRVK